MNNNTHLTEHGQRIVAELGITITHFPLDRERRKKFVTGTDIPKILGFGYGEDSIRTVIADKLGLIPDSNIGYKGYRGNYMEGLLFSEALLKNEDQLKTWQKTGPITVTFGESFVQSDMPLAVSMDCVIRVAGKILAIWEFKTTGAKWDEIPEKVYWQCQAQLLCTDAVEGIQVFWEDLRHEVKQSEVAYTDEAYDTIEAAVLEVMSWVKKGIVPEDPAPAKRPVPPNVKGKKPEKDPDDKMKLMEQELVALDRQIAELNTRHDEMLKPLTTKRDEIFGRFTGMAELGYRYTFSDGASFTQREQAYGGGISAEGYRNIIKGLNEICTRHLPPEKMADYHLTYGNLVNAQTKAPALKTINDFRPGGSKED